MRNRDGDDTYAVWIIDEEVFGFLVGPMGAYFSLVSYTKGGIDFEVLLENDEFLTMEEMFFDDDSE